ncbi:MAG: hypothetical protein M3441_22720 [Chloroflexota bacterium]|nr:hypothetical protein [Chloroflexota bacterium]
MESNGQEQISPVYEFGDFRLNTENKQLFLVTNNQLLKIQPMQLRLLCILVENHNRELSSEELFKHLWGTNLSPLGKSANERRSRTVDLNKLQSQVKLLRQVVGKGAIKNNPETGCYFFDESVRIVPPPQSPDTAEITPSPEPESVESTPEPDPEPVKVTPEPEPDDWQTTSAVISDFEFKDWLFEFDECLRIKIFLGVGVLFSLLYSIAYLLRDSIHAPWLGEYTPGVALSLIQVVVVGGALMATYFILDRNVKGFPSSEKADTALMEISGYTDAKKWQDAKAGTISSLTQFSRFWKFLLGAWAGLYLVLIFTIHFKVKVEEYKRLLSQGVQNLPADPSTLFTSFNIASTVFNNLNSLALALCFVVLNHPTVIRGDQQETSIDRVTKLIIGWGIVATVVFTLAEILLVFVPHQPMFDWMTPSNYMRAFDLVSGLAGAVTLSLCVGRVQSKFLGPSTWLPLALYFYVAIQSLYAAIPAESWGALMIEAALILKCLLYLYVAWLFKSGRLLFYFVRVKTVYQKTDIEWHGFLTNLNREQ